MHCPGGNATDPIWRVLASSDRISSWTPLKPLNIVTLTLTLWPINSSVLTSLLLPHLPSSLTDSLPYLNLLCHSKTDARFMQDGRKAVWSIPYVSVAFFPSLKQNFIAYRSLLRPDCIFEIHQLWQSGFSRVYSNCCCSFELEIIKNGQSSHKICSNNILNFQESMTILNACTKKSGNLLKAPRISPLNAIPQILQVDDVPHLIEKKCHLLDIWLILISAHQWKIYFQFKSLFTKAAFMPKPPQKGRAEGIKIFCFYLHVHVRKLTLSLVKQ